MTTVLSVEIIPNYANVNDVFHDGVSAHIEGQINPQLLYAQLVAAFPPPIVVNPLTGGETVIDIFILPPATQAQADALRVVVEAHDPSVLTPEQEEQADIGDIDSMLVAVRADRGLIRGPRVDGVQTEPGLKDHVKGTFGQPGIEPPLVAATFNALADDAARIRALRIALMGGTVNGVAQKGLIDVVTALLNADLHGINADIETLEDVRKLLNK